MKKIILFLLLAIAMSPTLLAQPARHFVGGDISLLPEYQKAGAKYLDFDGNPIPSLLPWLHEQGMNAMRVRLFVNPSRYKELHQYDSNDDTRYDPNACQDLEYILPLCREIVDNGFDIMLDFHYSDTWADPVKQWTPIDWEGLSDEELYAKIYDYTRSVLIALKEEGIVPAFIQPGNEISYGMLWGPAGTTTPKKTLMGSSANWQRLGNLLNQAALACREVCPDAQLVIHTERAAQPSVALNFYRQLRKLSVDYDIIGLSYYPYWHGDLNMLSATLSQLETTFPEKNIMIVETGYSYKWAVPGSEMDHTDKWPYSDAGQAKFATELVDCLEAHPRVNGLFWWWMEYNAFGTTLQGWYNAPLFDSTTGRACTALRALCAFNNTQSVPLLPADPYYMDRYYRLDGTPVAAPVPGTLPAPGTILITPTGHKILF